MGNTEGIYDLRSLSLRAAQQSARTVAPRAVVLEISSQEEFDKALGSAGDSLVVIDYSTSWCGPCKIIAPKFDEFSEQYKNVAFLKVMGDSSPEADKLMRSPGDPRDWRWDWRASGRTVLASSLLPEKVAFPPPKKN